MSSHSFIYSSSRLISCGRHQEAPSILRFHIALHCFSSLLVNLIITCFLSVLERLAFLDEFGQDLYACLGAEECCCEPVIWGSYVDCDPVLLVCLALGYYMFACLEFYAA